MSVERSRRVAVADVGEARYPAPPYSPDRRFPEYSFHDLAYEPNAVYSGVRDLLAGLGLDRERIGTPEWNPLGEWIRPGANVLIKPNLVRHYHPYGFDPASLVTHGSVIRAVCDYAWKATGPSGKVVIADAPLQSCLFQEVMRLAGVDAVAAYYQARGLHTEVRDLRLVRAVVDASSVYGRVLVQEENEGDPRGYTTVDLGAASCHAARPMADGRYRVTCYDPAKMSAYHGDGRHSYVIANTLLEADVVLNLPKMKTHHKAGITGAMKNFIGINGHKDCLPHHAKGAAEEGGDEYSRSSLTKRADSWLLDRKETSRGVLAQKTAAVAHRLLYAIHMNQREDSYWEGSWHGNDTISRTTIDLNRIVRYADCGGRLHDEPQRAVVTFVDGVIAGEKDGPLAPSPRAAGLLIAGETPAAVDAVMARCMGYRWDRIPTLRHAFGDRGPGRLAAFDPSEIEVMSESERWRGLAVSRSGHSLRFQPHRGWKGHVEL
ncbi:MAG: DUF362 domain-containing protein [Bryobacteraceae bacterium]